MTTSDKPSADRRKATAVELRRRRPAGARSRRDRAPDLLKGQFTGGEHQGLRIAFFLRRSSSAQQSSMCTSRSSPACPKGVTTP